jgi:hypothetical protein
MKEDDTKARVRRRVEPGRWWLIVVSPEFAHVLEPIRSFYFGHEDNFEIVPWAEFLLCQALKKWMSREQFAESLRKRFSLDSEESPGVAVFLKTHDCFFHGTEKDFPEILDTWLLSAGDA